MTALDQLNDALDRDDVSGALDHALAAWTELRGDALAAVISELYDRLPERPVISGANNAKRWLAVEAAADPRDIPRQVIYLRRDERMRIANMCVSALVKRPPNPVLARNLMHAIEAMPWRASAAADIYHQAIVMIARAGTAAEVPRLSALAKLSPHLGNAKLRDQLLVWIAQAIAQLRRPQPELDLAATHAALEQYANRQARQAARGEELLAAVYANLDDDGPRLVLADHLTQTGDPRGELIALQCQPQLTVKQTARVNKLVDTHGREWLAALGEDTVLKDGLHYERGFVARARLRLWRVRSEIVGHHLWTTLREADIFEGSTIDALLDPVCVSLRALYGIDGNALARIEATNRVLALEAIGLDYPGDDRLAGLADVANPKLRELHLRTPRAASIVRDLLARLPVLDRVHVGCAPTAEWRTLVGPRLRELVFDYANVRFRCDRPDLLRVDGGDAAAFAKQFGVAVELQ